MSLEKYSECAIVEYMYLCTDDIQYRFTGREWLEFMKHVTREVAGYLMYIGKTNIVKIGEHYFWKKLRTFKFTKSPNLGVKVRIWAVVLGYLQGSKLFY